MGLATGAWKDQLSNQRFPPLPESLAQFHARVAIIALGDVGAEVLDALIERLNATLPDPAKIALLHLQIPALMSSQGVELDRSTAVEDYRKFRETDKHVLQSIKLILPDGNDRADDISPQWEWLSLLKNPGHRAKARRALLEHVQINGSKLVRVLESLRDQGYAHYHIIGAVDEYGGCSLIGDLAALVRALSPMGQVHVDAYALLGAYNPNLAGQKGMQQAYLLATLLELSRFLTSTRMTIHFAEFPGNPLVYNPPEPPSALLDGAYLIVGGGKAGVQRAAYFLWGLSTSARFANQVRGMWAKFGGEKGARGGLTAVYARALVRPVGLLRRLQTARVLKSVLGDPNATDFPPYRSKVGVGDLNRELRNTSQGIYPALYTVSGLIGDGRSEEERNYYETLLEVFASAAERASRQIKDLESQLRSFESSSYKARSIDSEELRSWRKQKTVGADILDEIYKRYGFIAQSGDDVFLFHLTLLVAPSPKEMGPRKLFALTAHQMQKEYVDTLEMLVRRVVANAIQGWIGGNWLANLDAKGEFLKEWGLEQTFDRWRENKLQKLVRNANVVTPLDYVVTPTRAILQKYIAEDAAFQLIKGTDQTFVLQVLLGWGVPIQDVAPASNAPFGKSFVQSAFVHPQEIIAQDIFAPQLAADNYLERFACIPLSLLDALTHRRAVWAFYKVLRAGRLNEILDSSLSWEERLWSFISQYETGREAVTKLAREARFAEPDREFLDILEFFRKCKDIFRECKDNGFARSLFYVFYRFENNLDDLRTYPPPLDTDDSDDDSGDISDHWSMFDGWDAY